MADNDKTLTTAEFSKLTGIAVSTLTRMLRQGRLRGEKRSAKWTIYHSELLKHASRANQAPGQPTTGPGPIFDTPAAAEMAYDVETFAQMTYLTEKGVHEWLKTGRLSGCTDAGGRVLVDAANLKRPELQHLVRK